MEDNEEVKKMNNSSLLTPSAEHSHDCPVKISESETDLALDLDPNYVITGTGTRSRSTSTKIPTNLEDTGVATKESGSSTNGPTDTDSATRSRSRSTSTSSDASGRQQNSFSKLQSATQKALQRVTSKTKVLSYIKEHFKKVYRADSKNVIALYKSMMIQLEDMIKEEIEIHLSTNNVEHLLDQLDRVKLESESESPIAWRPSGHPKLDIKAHVQDILQHELQQLEKILCTLESKNKVLNECVVKSDEKLKNSLKWIQDNCADWEEAGSITSDETRTELLKLCEYLQ